MKHALPKAIVMFCFTFSLGVAVLKKMEGPTTKELYFDAQAGEVVAHVVSRPIFTDSVKVMRIADTESSLVCWSLTLGKRTHAVTCG